MRPARVDTVSPMRETLVEHLPNEETIISSRETGGTTLDVLSKDVVQAPVIFPIIETWLTGDRYGFLGDPQPTPQQRVWHRFAPGCFHDLFSATDQELAGAGLCIIGNLCKGVAAKQISSQCDARLELTLAKGAQPILLPWPGMPDARPLPLDLTELPFAFGMFLDDAQLKKRVDRLQLMSRIEDVWVSHLKHLLVVKL